MAFGWDYVLFSLPLAVLFWAEAHHMKNDLLAFVVWMAGNICCVTFLILFFLNIFYPLYLLKDIF